LYNPFGIQKIVNKYSKNRGRKRVEIDMEAMKNIPLKQRSTIRELANALGVKKSTKGDRRGKNREKQRPTSKSLPSKATKKGRILWPFPRTCSRPLSIGISFSAVIFKREQYNRCEQPIKFPVRIYIPCVEEDLVGKD
jgi:hypothetical protein